MFKEKPLIILLLTMFVAGGLVFFPGCDNDPVDDDTQPNDEVLVGTWYRYSLSEDGTRNNFYPGKFEILADSTGVMYTFAIEDGNQVEETNNFTWVTDNDWITVYGEENQTIFDLQYSVADGICTFTNSVGHHEILLQCASETDNRLENTWYISSRPEDGVLNSENAPDSVMFNDDGTFAEYWSGMPDNGTWFTREAYLVAKFDNNPNFNFHVLQFAFSFNDSTLTLTSNRAGIENDVWRGESIITTWSKTITPVAGDIVGTWQAYSIGGEGIYYTSVFNEDRTGSFRYWEGDDDTTESIKWETADGSNLIIYDASDNTEKWRGTYSFQDEGVSLTINIMEGLSIIRQDIFVKYTGNIDPNAVGTWIPTWRTIDDVYSEDHGKGVFNEDGSGTSGYVYEDQAQTANVLWSITGSYMLLAIEGLNGLTYVSKFEFLEDGKTKMESINSFNTEIIKTHHVEDTGDQDPELIGDWTLVWRSEDGVADPDLPDESMHLEETTGNYAGEDTMNFSWNSNINYLIYYPEETNYEVGFGSYYTFENDTLTVDYLMENGAGGTVSIDKLVKQ
ncbi:MAG: hypothetical protein P9L92_14430 [Candidatus Electryonea clarkiae]|nr:hypothetical protein [Candidatus Electryonea clarkiae]MDP8287352.1 hypothetical protein [Candidatus Electryonea clarkiae]